MVKGQDGNFHKEGKPDEKLSVDEVKKVVIKADPTATPIGISNVASGLGLPAPETDPQKAAEAKQKTAELTKAVEYSMKEVAQKAKELSEKVQNVTDLKQTVSVLKQAIEATPEGPAKANVAKQLTDSEGKLVEAQKALDTAKAGLNKARQDLAKANDAYEKNYEGYAKVADLVSADSQADLSNVATIADLQAVAKSGMKFKGNDGMEARTPLSGTLEIKGEGGTFDSSAAGNIKVEMAKDGKGLEVKLSDTLKNMTFFETKETAEGNKSCRITGNS
ncbi:hypothetical protein CFY87_05255 [Actinobacillus seminis]|uniref:Membrane-bound metallopeptidase n=1 Tax=Actinobacillus seminis TaxID=722 RepID=A0A263HE05_9PAST|nr:hypothetical protein CFY87_05255 [Actinobacillus seminis]SUU33831.1 Membrane-bound metallopeptidase [Actinobacillus seminis]